MSLHSPLTTEKGEPMRQGFGEKQNRTTESEFKIMVEKNKDGQAPRNHHKTCKESQQSGMCLLRTHHEKSKKIPSQFASLVFVRHAHVISGIDWDEISLLHLA
jgi:hypothetical protein